MDLEKAKTFITDNAASAIIAVLIMVFIIILFFGWNPSEGFCGGFDSGCLCSGNELK